MAYTIIKVDVFVTDDPIADLTAAVQAAAGTVLGGPFVLQDTGNVHRWLCQAVNAA